MPNVGLELTTLNQELYVLQIEIARHPSSMKLKPERP